MSDKKNIILITVDCLRQDHLSCYGYQRATSPNMDKLARKGVLFDQAIANGPNTFCSFPSILTSTFALMNIIRNEKAFPPNWIFLSEENSTIAEILKTAGYSTYAFHTNPWISSYFNYDRGFDHFEDFQGKIGKSLVSKDLSLKHKTLHYLRLLKGFSDILHKQSIDITHLNQMAISCLKEHHHRPFFLWLHYMDVHAPYVPPNPTMSDLLAAISMEVELRRTNKCSSQRCLQTLMNFYDRKIIFVDREIGRFLNELEKMGFSSENTYTILTSDHGEQMMEHGFVGHGLLYDEVIHVPLIFCGPEIGEDIVVKKQVEHLDLCPTITDLLRVPKVNSFQGNSLLPLLKKGIYQKKGVISESISSIGTKHYSFRTKQSKYILLFDRNGKVRRDELYDLTKDSREKKNLVEEHGELAKKFRAHILRHIEMEETYRKSSTKLEFDQNSKKLIENRLRDLGYM
jgi:arylsulfatase A-like enzyme